MEMRAIEQAIRQLVTVGRCPSVRTVRDITGGSQRDVSKLLREFRGQSLEEAQKALSEAEARAAEANRAFAAAQQEHREADHALKQERQRIGQDAPDLVSAEVMWHENPILTRAAIAQDLVKAKEQMSRQMGEAVRVAKLELAHVQQTIERKTTDIATQRTRMDKQADEMAQLRVRLAQLEQAQEAEHKRLITLYIEIWQLTGVLPHTEPEAVD
jgi:hypothetical protein